MLTVSTGDAGGSVKMTGGDGGDPTDDIKGSVLQEANCLLQFLAKQSQSVILVVSWGKSWNGINVMKIPLVYL
jgi:hypothetical protein